MLKIENLRVRVEGKEILKGVDLEVLPGEVVAIMGPNGSGKSTLAYSLMGHPGYKVIKGRGRFLNRDLLKLSVDERARRGLFLGWQNPVVVKGVTVEQMLRAARMNCRCEVCGKENNCMIFSHFREELRKKAKELKIKEKFLERSINDGFSGGERKKIEILQLMSLKPKLAILDETDSGLDIDALKIVARGVNLVKKENKEMGVLLITHYSRILRYIKPDRLLIMKEGKIVKEDGPELVRKLEKEGYEGIE